MKVRQIIEQLEDLVAEGYADLNVLINDEEISDIIIDEDEYGKYCAIVT